MKVVAAILVGGQSRRMGRNKALLPISGKILVEKIEESLQELSKEISQIVLSGELEGRETVKDLYPTKGPVGAIHTLACRFMNKAQGLLVVPVDLPCFESQVVLPLMLEFVENKTSYVFFKGHPLPALFSLNQKLIEESREFGSVSSLLNRLNAKAIDLDLTDLLINTNTPKEWKDATGDVL